MKKYIVLFSLFIIFGAVSFIGNLEGAIFISALLAGYYLSKIQYQYKYSRKYRPRPNSLYVYRVR